jgi:hypothetical protein
MIVGCSCYIFELNHCISSKWAFFFFWIVPLLLSVNDVCIVLCALHTVCAGLSIDWCSHCSAACHIWRLDGCLIADMSNSSVRATGTELWAAEFHQ